MGPVTAPGKGPLPARDGRGRGGPGGPQAPSAAGWPVGSLVTCALPSIGWPPVKCAASGAKPGNHMPLPPMVPVGTGRHRDFAGRRDRERTSDPGHIRTTRPLRFFRRWPGWRQVALMGRSDQRFTHLRKKVFGRCPPCLLSHTSQPASRVKGVRPPHPSPPPRRPISAPTNGWSRSCTSATSRTLVPLTGPGGASSPTTSPLSPTGWPLKVLSRSSASSPPPPRRPPRHRPPRLRRSHRRRRVPRPLPLPRFSRHPPPHLPRPPSLLPRAQPCLLPQAQQYLLPLAQLCLLPQARPRAPRSAGCAARRPAPSPT
jgi:hypothetical protein